MSIDTSIETFKIPESSPVPEEKRRRIGSYAKRHTHPQDHGGAAQRKGRIEADYYDPDSILNTIHPRSHREALKNQAMLEQLSDLSPAQLEALATELITEAEYGESATFESDEYFVKPPNEEFEGFYSSDDEGRSEEPYQTLTDSYFRDAVKQGRLMRGRSGHRQDPEAWYQGRGSGIGAAHETHITDDENLTDVRNPLEGFSVKDRP